MGSANVWVSNIPPHGPPLDPNHGVAFVLNVDVNSDLNVLVDITLLDSRVVLESNQVTRYGGRAGGWPPSLAPMAG